MVNSMNEVKIYEMSVLMPVYWTDGIDTIRLITIEQNDGDNKDGSQTKNYQLPKRAQEEIIRIIRDTTKSKKLKKLYNNKCQVCRMSLPLIDGFYSEVHHLQPLGEDHKGPDDQANMVVVCPNHHALFDAGAIAIIPDTLKVITYNCDEIGSLFIEANHIIDDQFIRYHFKKRFKQTS